MQGGRSTTEQSQTSLLHPQMTLTSDLGQEWMAESAEAMKRHKQHQPVNGPSLTSTTQWLTLCSFASPSSSSSLGHLRECRSFLRLFCFECIWGSERRQASSCIAACLWLTFHATNAACAYLEKYASKNATNVGFINPQTHWFFLLQNSLHSFVINDPTSNWVSKNFTRWWLLKFYAHMIKLLYALWKFMMLRKRGVYFTRQYSSPALLQQQLQFVISRDILY